MTKKNKGTAHSDSIEGDGGCCQVESVISVDDRGQLVLPKEIREKAGIRAGDKLAVVSWKRKGEICCISLIRVGELAGMVKNILGPVIKEVMKE